MTRAEQMRAAARADHLEARKPGRCPLHGEACEAEQTDPPTKQDDAIADLVLTLLR